MEEFAEGVKKGLKVKVGRSLEVIGNEGVSHLHDKTKGLHPHVEVPKGKTAFQGKRLGIR